MFREVLSLLKEPTSGTITCGIPKNPNADVCWRICRPAPEAKPRPARKNGLPGQARSSGKAIVLTQAQFGVLVTTRFTEQAPP